jgi:ech hydrogenase subunit F
MFTFVRTLLRNLTHKPATRTYPFTKREPFANFRGHLTIDPKTCIYCGICAKRCPANAIVVGKAPKAWTLDPYKCILCSYCVEACPKKCMTMHPEHQRKDA